MYCKNFIWIKKRKKKEFVFDVLSQEGDGFFLHWLIKCLKGSVSSSISLNVSSLG